VDGGWAGFSAQFLLDISARAVVELNGLSGMDQLA